MPTWVSGDDLQAALSMHDAISALREAFAADGLHQPPRTRVALADPDACALLMAATHPTRPFVVIKTVTYSPSNPIAGRPLIQGVVQVLDVDTGDVVAMLDAGPFTALRTAATSALATDHLARADARVLGLIGSGVQAHAHVEALCAVRPINEVRVFSPTKRHRDAFVARCSDGSEGLAGSDIVAVDAAAAAVKDADIVCTVTTSGRPVVAHGDLAQGVHINAVGAFSPQRRELDSDTVAHARLFVDAREAAMAEAGDILIPRAQGRFGAGHIHGDLADLVTGRVVGRTDEREQTVFKSCGLALEDAAVAVAAMDSLGLSDRIESPSDRVG